MELQGSQASDRCSSLCFNICKSAGTGFLKETSGQFPEMLVAKRDVDINSLIAVKNLND